MASKHAVLKLLEQQRGEYLSGEYLASVLSISRAAVWRSISTLRSEGHKIEASTKVGYRLLPASDIISPEGILPHLWETTQAEIHCYDIVDSTNTVAKSYASRGAKQGTVIVSAMQTQGRGRNGKAFYSPGESGVYLSIILRPQVDVGKALLITSAVAVAVCRAIDEITKTSEAQIKWVNDIFLQGKKVCGILTEGVTGFESGKVESVIVGIGINLTEPTGGFPSDLQHIAGSLFSKGERSAIPRNRVVASIINHVLAILSDTTFSSYLREYRKRSLVVGRDVSVIKGDGTTYHATALEITNEGMLVVRDQKGTIHTLQSGEISLRPLGEETWN